MQTIVKYILDNREAIIWLVALTILATMNPEQQHASICPLSLMDLGFCPGCGLGHSIAYLFRGELLLSLKSHPLGVFALGMLSYRIIYLSIRNYKLK